MRPRGTRTRGGVQGEVLWGRLSPAGEAGSGTALWSRQGLSWVLQHWGHSAFMGGQGEAAHSRWLGHGDGDASLKEQGFSGGRLTLRGLASESCSVVSNSL